MSNNENYPTQEQVRQVRQAAFEACLAPISDSDSYQRLLESRNRQDANRERNVSSFVQNITGSDA